MPKIEIPGVTTPSPPGPAPAPAPPPAPPEEPEAQAPAPSGEPLEEGGLDPILSEAVASQPEVPPPEPAGDPDPAPSPPAARPPAAGSAPPTVPRPRALGGLLVAGALALAGAVLTVALGGKHGRATHPKPTGTGDAGGAFPGFGDGFFDPAERELAKFFGVG